VQPARREVRADEDGRRGILPERCQRGVALTLRLVAVQRDCQRGRRAASFRQLQVRGKTGGSRAQVRRELLRRCFSRHKNDYFALLQQPWQHTYKGCPLGTMRQDMEVLHKQEKCGGAMSDFRISSVTPLSSETPENVGAPELQRLQPGQRRRL
jgi:hypothetical protein